MADQNDLTRLTNIAMTHSLYTMSCRNYDATGMTEQETIEFRRAFDQCFDTSLPRPGIILQRCRNWNGYWIGERTENAIKDPFLWRIVWVNQEGMTQGPYPRLQGGIAIIEDEYLDYQNWYPTRDEPGWSLNRIYIPLADIRVEEERNESPIGQLHPQELYDYFTDMFVPKANDDMIELQWWRDAFLPCHIIDGVPESQEHSEFRLRVGLFHGYGTIDSWSRSYQERPGWREQLEGRAVHPFGHF